MKNLDVKYSYTGKTKVAYLPNTKIATRQTLYQIKAEKTFITSYGEVIEKGSIGGYIAEGSLSQNGTCWVSEDSIVAGNAYIDENAYIKNCKVWDAVITGDAICIDSEFYGEKTKVEGYVISSVIDNSKVRKGATIKNSNLTKARAGRYLKESDEAALKSQNAVTISNSTFTKNCIIGNSTILNSVISTPVKTSKSKKITLIDVELNNFLFN